MANGDDGYADVGGGGSVQWRLRVSEGPQVKPTPADGAHRTRSSGLTPWELSGRDSYAKAGDPPIEGGEECLTVTITDVNQIRGIQMANGALRLYVPVSTTKLSAPPDEPDLSHKDKWVPQIRLRWGMRVIPKELITVTQLVAKLGGGEKDAG